VEFRDFLKASFFRFLARVANADQTREIVSSELRRLNLLLLPNELMEFRRVATPYSELGLANAGARQYTRSKPVFVTGRFRSGTTLVWNLFRHVPAVTAYYEPFNERRWFDRTRRGIRVDASHVGVDNYWREYDSLPELASLFREEWKFQHLYMNGGSVNSAMQAYIETLVEKAPGRAVLQFNEVDFRLSWLKSRFPSASIVHIYRHPRDQWLSTVANSPLEMLTLTIAQFEGSDGFYLCRWGRDLRHYFPFLDLGAETHPYKLFYQIWRLSHLFGALHGDLSISLEEVSTNPAESIARMMSSCDMVGYDLSTLADLVRPPANRRVVGVDVEDLFHRIEQEVETELEKLVPESSEVTHGVR
jgi:hypothetical protein